MVTKNKTFGGLQMKPARNTFAQMSGEEVKMKNTNVFMLFVAMFILTNISLAGEFEITGYQSGIFSLTDPQEIYLNKKMAEISEEFEALKRKSGGNSQIDLTIDIIGFADKEGVPSKNDTLSQDRAKQVNQYLFGKFPKAIITVKSKGDQKDVKKVVVNWKFSIQPLADNGKQNIVIPKPSSKSITAIVLFVGIFLLVSLIFIGLIIAKTRKIPTIPVKADSQSVPKNISSWIVEVFFPRKFLPPKKYLVPIVACQNGIWSSLVPQMKSSECLFHKDPNVLRRTLEGCSAPQRIEFYRPIFKNLAKKGAIKIKK